MEKGIPLTWTLRIRTALKKKWLNIKLWRCWHLKNKSWKPCVLSFNMDWRIKFTNIPQPMLKLILASMIYSDMSNKSTNMVVYFDWKTVIYIYVCGKCRHTIYAANGKVSHIHRRMCKWDYTIDKSLVCLQSERRTSY